MELNEGHYTFKAQPMDNRTWEKTNDVEVVFTIDTDSEKKTFRGKATLTGIIKKGG